MKHLTLKEFLIESETLHLYVVTNDPDKHLPDYKFVKTVSSRPEAEQLTKSYNSKQTGDRKLVILTDTMHKDIQRKKR